jgi:hypothetical protein
VCGYPFSLPFIARLDVKNSERNTTNSLSNLL